MEKKVDKLVLLNEDTFIADLLENEKDTVIAKIKTTLEDEDKTKNYALDDRPELHVIGKLDKKVLVNTGVVNRKVTLMDIINSSQIGVDNIKIQNLLEDKVLDVKQINVERYYKYNGYLEVVENMDVDTILKQLYDGFERGVRHIRDLQIVNTLNNLTGTKIGILDGGKSKRFEEELKIKRKVSDYPNMVYRTSLFEDMGLGRDVIKGLKSSKDLVGSKEQKITGILYHANDISVLLYKEIQLNKVYENGKAYLTYELRGACDLGDRYAIGYV